MQGGRFSPETPDPARVFLLVSPRLEITLIDGAAQTLLGLSPKSIRSTPCYQVMGFRLPDGGPFCGARCAARARLGASFPSAEFHSLRRGEAGDGSEFCLSCVALQPTAGPGLAVLHMLVPASRCPAAHDGRTPRAVTPQVPGPESGPPGGTEGRRGARQSEESHAIPSGLPLGHGRLTRREQEVLSRIASGSRTPEIARHLFISPHTVRRHVQHIMQKLQVHHRLGAVLKRMRRPEPASSEDDAES
jgi:DNA-binding CsgD family transcriptional regulator